MKGLGVVHVLTGPDHLSALATLSANVGHFQAFWYGVRWGVGHSIGLLLVGSILVIVDLTQRSSSNNTSGSDDTNGNGNDDGNGGGEYDENAPIQISEAFQSLCESLVGIFMILLGIYSMMNILQEHRRSSRPYEDDPLVNQHNENEQTQTAPYQSSSNHDDNGSGDEELFEMDGNNTNSNNKISPQSELELQLSNSRDKIIDEPQAFNVHNGEASMTIADVSYDAVGISTMSTSPSQNNQDQTSNNECVLIHHHHNHQHHHEHCLHCCNCGIIPKPILSLGIGIIHGVAGPGGVLGVLPAVELHNWKLATVYLSTFCLTSTLTMGSYAAIYGSCSSYLSMNKGHESSRSRQFYMEMFSAGLSLFVGALWLFLLSIGKLHDIFP